MKSDILILLNKDKPGLSETFIQNHIDYLKAPCYNIEHFKPIKLYVFYPFVNRLVDKISRKLRIKKFGKFTRFHGTKIVLAEYGTTGAYAYELCKAHNLKLIVHFHGQDAHRQSLIKMFGEAYKLMFEYASAIVVVSSSMRRSLIQLGCPIDKITLNPYGVDESKFCFQKKLNTHNQIFSIGRFVDKKAPYLLILAFQKVLVKVPTATLVIAGNGLLFEVCSRMIKALHLENSIKLVNSISHEEVIRLMQESNLYIQHSVVAFDGDSEGLPNTILEAAAIGLPIVATKHAGIADFIQHGVHGLLVDENDVDEMANQINHLLLNPEKGYELAWNARNRIQENYTLNFTLNNLIQLITKSYS